MKKKYIIFSIVVLILFVTLSICFDKFKTTNTYIEDSSNNQIKITKGISMNLEQTAGAGDYKQVTQSNWPTEGYKFNSELSRCENGSTLSWDDTKKTIVFSGDVSDKCYVYFDKILTLASYVVSQYTGTQGENSIYYHDSALANGAGDNSYRYAGASDSVNNFVCFGTNESPCPTDNLYRIIGVVDDKVKLIKYDYATSDLLGTDGDYCRAYSFGNGNYKGDNYANIASYYWNYKATNNATNTWSTSLLNKTNLNTKFINSIGTEWANRIAMTTWKVGGNTITNIISVTPSEAYQNEIVSPVSTNSTDNATEYSAKIGLMYVTDYEFAASQDMWTLYGYNIDSTKDYIAAINNNWMYMGLYEWTISRRADDSDSAFSVFYDGDVFIYDVGNDRAVRPSFNLESSVKYVSGSGSMSDPVRVN